MMALHRGSLLRAREDFALESVPPTSRSRRALAILNVLLGIPTALVFFATGAELQRAFGTESLIAGIAIVTVIVSIATWILTSFAWRSGLDSDLASIPAGFGVRGSAITSAIYSVNFIVLFALEDDIIATAVTAQFPSVPRWLVLITVACAFIAFNWHGITSLSVLMAVTLPLFLVLIGAFLNRVSFSPISEQLEPQLTLLGVVAVGGALMAFIVNATVAADVARFLGPRYGAAGSAVLAIALQLASFVGSIGLGAWMGKRLGISNPGEAFVLTLGIWGVIAVISSQFRINLINLYAGSLSLSNFGQRAFGWRPGRAWWSVILAIAGTSLAFTNIYDHLLAVLTFEAIFTCAWVGVLIAAILKRRLLRLEVGVITSVRTYDFGGIAALGAALALSVPVAFGVAGNDKRGLAPFIALFAAMIIMFAIEAAPTVLRRKN